MAKKTNRKTAARSSRSGGSAGKKGASGRTSSGKRPAAAGSKKNASRAKRPAGAKPRPTSGPFTVSTGRGPSAAEIGKSLVELYNAGKWDEPCRLWWSPDIVSVEGMGMAWAGRRAVDAKNEGWNKEHTPLGGSAEGPFVGASGFSVKFRMEIKENATGNITRMEEIGVYTVQDGKIVREEFMYGAMTVEEGAG
jgi:hypothetical protein